MWVRLFYLIIVVVLFLSLHLTYKLLIRPAVPLNEMQTLTGIVETIKFSKKQGASDILVLKTIDGKHFLYSNLYTKDKKTLISKQIKVWYIKEWYGFSRQDRIQYITIDGSPYYLYMDYKTRLILEELEWENVRDGLYFVFLLLLIIFIFNLKKEVVET